MSDQKIRSNQKKALVAITGRLDSMVSAYLLKKQGYQVFGLGIIFGKETQEKDKKKKKRKDQKNSKRKAGPSKDGDTEVVTFEGFYPLDPPKKVKNICDQLDIPFYATDATDLYEYLVTDQIIASRALGFSYAPRVYVTEMIFKILIEKAQELQCHWVASGHYAKIIKNPKGRQYNIYTASDSKCDQSYLLSRLDQSILKRTLLPLSEMQKQEVEKIGSLLKVSFLISKKMPFDFMHTKAISNFVKKRLPASLKKSGAFVDVVGREAFLDQHEGIHLYYLGQNISVSPLGSRTNDHWIIIKIDYETGKIFLVNPERARCRKILLREFTFQSQLDMTKPFNVFLRTHSQKKFLAGTLIFKNNNHILIEIEEKVHNDFFPGEYCVVYHTMGKLTRIIGGGVITTAQRDTPQEFDILGEKKIDQEEKYKKEIKKRIHHACRF